MERVFALYVLGALVISTGTQNISRPTYLITAPKVLHPDVPIVLSVTVFSQSPIRVTAKIFKDLTSIAQGEKEFLGGSTGIQVLPPITDTNSNNFDLEVKGYVTETEVFSNKILLKLMPRSSATFIQMDKSNYKPGQSVKIRVMSIYADGKPNKNEVNLFIKDPKGNLIQQWISLDTFLGVASKEFQLSKNPPLGMWTIEASVNNVQTEKQFFVDYYVLPLFQVAVKAPSVICLSQDNLAVSISAQYTYGKPVRGLLTLLVESEYYKTINITKEINGSTDFEFSESDFGIWRWVEDGSSEIILHVTALITETLTGLKSNASAEVTAVQNKYHLMFYGYSRQLKPSLNFSGYLKISMYDMKPLILTDKMKNVMLTIVQNKYNVWEYGLFLHNENFNSSFNNNQTALKEEESYILPSFSTDTQTISLPVPANGIVPIQFPLLDGVQSVSVEAVFEDSRDTLKLSTKYFSPSNSYLQLCRANFPQQGNFDERYNTQESPAQVGVPLPLTAHTNFPLTDLYYLVMSKGQVVAVGKETSASFSLKPEGSWTPLASIIVYTIHTTGEVVKDALQVPVSEALKNNVSLSWSQTSAKPAEKVELKVSVSEQSSLVGILVVDKATQSATSSNDISKDEVLGKLMKISMEGTNQIDDSSYSIFTENNLEVLTDAMLTTLQPINQPVYRWGVAFAQGVDEEILKQEPQVRRDFPETWLWLDVNMSDSTTKSLSVTAPDSITSWIATAFVMSDNLGLGLIDAPAKLTVFQNFFISLNLPAYIIRGEQLVLEVNLFNYLDKKIEVMVMVGVNSSFEFVLETTNGFGAHMRTVSVGGHDSASALFPIRPKVLGEISISVKAVSNVASDAIIREVLVKPEGVEQMFTKTLFLELAPSNNSLYQEIPFLFPEDVVEGSERAYVTVVGDVLGQAITGLESLIQVPYGCGEQNMINFAPNVYVLQYLTKSNRVTEKIHQKAISLMLKGYQQELAYQRSDGSFSAFGNSDSSGSTWLSAFVLRCFLQSRPFITVEETVLSSTVKWLIQMQNRDGSFVEPGTVIHTELQGGLDGPVSLTAYVLMALLEGPIYMKIYSAQVSLAVTFLENVTFETCSNYSLSLVAYALSLVNGSKAEKALSELMRRADVKDGIMSWRTPGMNLVGHWQASSTDIEIAAYVLLAMFTQGMVVEGLSLMKWLCQQQNHLGGYGSTQDTIIALQALSYYASLSGADAINLRITVNTTASRDVTIFQVDSTNYLLHQSQKVKTKENMRVGVSMVGRGFVLFQLNVFYNLNNRGLSRKRRSTQESEAFALDVKVTSEDADRLNILICTRLQESQMISQTGMVLIEVGLLSGFIPHAEAIETNDVVRKVETPPGKVVLYLESVNKTEVCVTVLTVRKFKVSHVQDATVIIYDYYNNQRYARRTYNSELLRNIPICTFCGSKCSLCQEAAAEVSRGLSLKLSPQSVTGCLLILPLFFLSHLLS